MAGPAEPAEVDLPEGAAQLTVSVAAPVSRRRALALLDDPGRGAWLGETVEGEGQEGGRDRHLVDLELRVNEQTPRITFRKAAFVDVGPVTAQPDGPIWLRISWRAAGLAPLFPVFSGRLTWNDAELRLEGFYAPPGGGVGVMADRLLLNVAARGTARLLLERISAAMRSSAS